MELSRLLEKIARGYRLSENEINDLRFQAQALEEIKSLVKGWVNPGTAIPIFQPPMELFYSKILEEDTASLTIQIPNKYKHLIVTGIGRTTATPATPQEQSLNFTFNGDTGTNYQWSYTASRSGAAAVDDQNSQSNLPFGMFNTDNCDAGSASSFFTFIPHYTGGFWKMCLSIIAGQKTTTATGTETALMTGFWKSTNPIQSMTVVPGGGLGGSLKAGSLLAVYGML